jgi:hypothetical protein
MSYNRFDSYFYSRPVSYRSYYPRLTKQTLLSDLDPDTTKVNNFLRSKGVEVNDLGGISRGIRFGDL